MRWRFWCCRWYSLSSCGNCWAFPFQFFNVFFLERWFRFEKTLFHSFLMLSFKISQMTCLCLCFDCNWASKWFAYCYCYHYKQGFVCKIFVEDLCCFFNTADDSGFWWCWLVFLFDWMVHLFRKCFEFLVSSFFLVWVFFLMFEMFFCLIRHSFVMLKWSVLVHYH